MSSDLERLNSQRHKEDVRQRIPGAIWNILNSVPMYAVAILLASAHPAYSQKSGTTLQCGDMPVVNEFMSITQDPYIQDLELEYGLSANDFRFYFSRENMEIIFDGNIEITNMIQEDTNFQDCVLPILHEIYIASGIIMRDDAITDLFQLYQFKRSGDMVNWAVYAVYMVDIYKSVPDLEGILVKYNLFPTDTAA